MPYGADEKSDQPTSRDLLNAVDAELAAGEQKLRSMIVAAVPVAGVAAVMTTMMIAAAVPVAA